MVFLLLLCVCCCGCKGSDKRQDQVLLQRWKKKETLLLQEISVESKRTMYTSSLFRSSTSVDVTELTESITVKPSRLTNYQ
ncbi:hypothetical protein Bpfe_013515 [Biomphalaria pfeifferi]|uniref:Secreted protein n=1 Tax=Biomphalaria pfeifferi TaxID=112525 RepID=A0AAD8BMP5_BIOPF|nr:hypothetical protein Bpfe_013515 [Biomphalaria pfeifferi]